MTADMLIFGVVAVALGALPAAAQGTDNVLLHQLRADIGADRQAPVAANLGLPEAEVARFLQIANKLDAIVSIGLAGSIPLIRADG